MDKVEKNEFTDKAPEEDGTQAFASRTKGDKLTLESKVISLSRSTIYASFRLRKNVRSQDKEVLLPRIAKIRRFLVMVTMNSLGN